MTPRTALLFAVIASSGCTLRLGGSGRNILATDDGNDFSSPRLKGSGASSASSATAAPAKSTQTLELPELGIALTVPGDVTHARWSAEQYGQPAFELIGRNSDFGLYVTSAEHDKLGLEARMKATEQEFNRTFRVVHQERSADGGWKFTYQFQNLDEAGYSIPGVFTGYFEQRLVQGKRVNCFFADNAYNTKVQHVVDACSSIVASASDSRSASRAK